MSRPFTPRAYQADAMRFLIERPRCALWASMGAGKTVSTLSVLDALAPIEPDPVLILAPRRVALSTWPGEAREWKHLAGVEVVPVTGTADERRRALKRDAQFFATNYEQLPWLVDLYGDSWPFRTIVADEATRLKGFRLRQGTQRARALGRVAWKRVDRFIELTGTPSPNGLIDLWGQVWFLDQGARLGRTFDAFVQRWFRPHPSGYGVEPLDHAQEEIQSRLADICLTVDVRDSFDIREPIRNVIHVDLPRHARSHYDRMEREMFTEIEEKGVEAFSAAGRATKCAQIANGAVYTDDTGAWEEIHDAKLEALESVIEEANGAPVLVSYFFVHDRVRLLRRFQRARELDADPRTIDDWNAGRIPILLAHPQAAGHGLNLQHGGNTIVFFGMTWNLEHHQQIAERLGPVRQMQSGYDRPVWEHYLLARDTIDVEMHDRLQTKASVQDALLAAMKRGSK